MYRHGWYQVAFERDLVASITPLAFGDRPLMAVRRDDGVGVYDATCPHRGAHLAFGGAVDGGDVRCPFHNYQIGLGRDSNDGFCVAGLPTLVHGGMVFIRLSDSNDVDLPAALEELGADHTFWPGFEMEASTSIEMVMENGFDNAHFDAVHGLANRPLFETTNGALGELVVEGTFQIPSNDWFSGNGGESVKGGESVRGKARGAPMEAHYRARAFSPGAVIATLDGEPPFNYTIITTASPGAEDGTCTIRLTLALPRTGTPPHEAFAPALLEQSRRGLEQDCEIWNRLSPSTPPRFTELDAAVIEFARFCKKFCA